MPLCFFGFCFWNFECPCVFLVFAFGMLNALLFFFGFCVWDVECPCVFLVFAFGILNVLVFFWFLLLES